MFKKLLVPLDGSALAETVLSAAAFLAQKFEASVTLLHVIEHNAPQEIHGDRHLSEVEDARAYLNSRMRQVFPVERAACQHVHTEAISDVAGAIVAHAKEFSSDLIIMCTHGSGGLKGFLFGRIAQRVIASGSTPVLIINPEKEWQAPEQGCGCLLIPLDGEAQHEGGLPAAAELARACEASLHLLRVVPTLKTLRAEHAVTGRLMPGSTAAMLELAKEEAMAYLRKKGATLKETGIDLTCEVLRGEPAKTIIKASKKSKADLIVLGTHGKTGTDAFWSGSITPKVCAGCNVPILLVPVFAPFAPRTSSAPK
jgi:nucleotide-binding universal stress UspA family protein